MTLVLSWILKLGDDIYRYILVMLDWEICYLAGGLSIKEESHLDYILVVIIDDDTKDNARYLYQKYASSLNETILIFSPVRNIESWFCYIDTGNFHVENKDE